MSSSMDYYATPAGCETDCSDEWDIEPSFRKPPCIQDAVALYGEDDLSKLKNSITSGDTEAVKQLLDNGLDVETRLSCDWTLLMSAVNIAEYNIAKLLLDRGANASFSQDHWTVLMASITAFAKEDKIAHCVELLLSRNADPNMVDSSQMSCLMLAAQEGYCKVINLLVSHGAEINAQDNDGYTALSIAVRYGREEAVLKLLQLGADQNIQTNAGKCPADLAVIFKHTQISKILASSSHISTRPAISSRKQTLSSYFETNSEAPSSKECVMKLDELELFLHGLDLGYLTDIMTENDITWSHLMTMEAEDLEKIGVKDPGDQQKVLRAIQQIRMDSVDLATLNQLGVSDVGSEELQNFLISVRQQCCYLTETIQDVNAHFPRYASQIVFSLDPKKEARAICSQVVVQTKDLQKEVICLHNLLCQLDKSEDCCQPPQLGSQGSWRMQFLSKAALGVLGATALLVLYSVVSRQG